MQFTPKSEEQLAEENLIPKGVYDFEVIEAHDKVSKAARQRGETVPNMIHVKLKVYETGERGIFVDDYLMPEMGFKLRHFCAEVGLLDQYDAGALTAEMCNGRAGKVFIIQGKAQNGYPPKNEVKDYGDPKSKNKPQSADSIAQEQADPDWDVATP
jgi:hypothetical protein